MALNATIFDVDNGQQDKSSILIFNLSEILQKYIHNLPLVFFLFGLFGFIGNLVTYLQPELRTNTCCIYSLCGSVVDIVHLLINAFPTFLTVKFNVHIEWAVSSHSCRMFYFLLVCLPNMSINFLVMSMIDRFACTCELTSEITSFEPTESNSEDNQSDHRDQLSGIDLCSAHGLSRMERILLFY